MSRIQKTFVISRRTLACLDEISRQSRAPRDALVEYSIQRLLPVIHARAREASPPQEAAAMRSTCTCRKG
ncbi:MAG: hypothetical protein MZV70_43945 [Desulfobacterales bacterium]|nr:hypothetical protein [Desulfobacterales bacterium]